MIGKEKFTLLFLSLWITVSCDEPQCRFEIDGKHGSHVKICVKNGKEHVTVIDPYSSGPTPPNSKHY